MTNAALIKLSSRGVVRVTGTDSLRFLQGLITNDMHRICGPDAPSTCSAAFLNGRGRVLFGTLLHRHSDNHYLIDVEQSQIPSLLTHLTKYRLRAKVDISDASPEHTVWAYLGDRTSPGRMFFRDPRGLIDLGFRAILTTETSASMTSTAEEKIYTRLRIEQGVPDDGDFHTTPLPLDLGLHMLGGVSFSKGCYLGQELTARSHFTGVLRKRITPVTVSEGELVTGTEIFRGTEGKMKALGKVTSACDDMGLVVLRLSDAFDKTGTPVALKLVDGRVVMPKRSTWWPTEEWQQQLDIETPNSQQHQ